MLAMKTAVVASARRMRLRLQPISLPADFVMAGYFTGEKVSQVDMVMSRDQVISILERPDGDRAGPQRGRDL